MATKAMSLEAREKKHLKDARRKYGDDVAAIATIGSDENWLNSVVPRKVSTKKRTAHSDRTGAPPVDNDDVLDFVQRMFYKAPEMLYELTTANLAQFGDYSGKVDKDLVKDISEGDTTLPVVTQWGEYAKLEILEGVTIAIATAQAGYTQANVVVVYAIPDTVPSGLDDESAWRYSRNLRFAWERQYSLYTRVDPGGLRQHQIWRRFNDDGLPKAERGLLRSMRKRYLSVYTREERAFKKLWKTLNTTQRDQLVDDLLQRLLRKSDRDAATELETLTAFAKVAPEGLYRMSYMDTAIDRWQEQDGRPSAEVTPPGANRIVLYGRKIDEDALQKAVSDLVESMQGAWPESK